MIGFPAVSKPKRPEPHAPVRYSDLPHALLAVDVFQVVEWNPNADGSGEPQQVHILFPVPELDVQFVIRLKSRRAADELIAALNVHADGVWPR